MRVPLHSKQSIGLNAALLALGLAPVLLMLYTVVSLWLPLPYWDEWTTPGDNLVSWCNGTLTWPELFSQHNESRKFFPRLLYLGLAALNGWDVRQEMALTFLSVAAISFLFYRLMRGTAGDTTHAALITWVAAAFLCFSSVQLENFLWGVQLEVFFPGLALLAITSINLSRLSIGWKSALNAVFALIATYTVAHGMLLWLLGIPLLTRAESLSARRTILPYGVYLLCAIAAIVPYFIDYHRPPQHPEMLAGDAGPLQLAHYLILWVGSYFNSSLFPPFGAGLAAVVLFSICLIWGFVLIRKQGDWRAFYPALMIAAYACATASLTAFGRIGFGVEQALNIRYRSYSLFFYLAIVALLFSIHCRQQLMPRLRQFFLFGCSVVALVGLIGWIACCADGFKQQKLLANRNTTLLRALEWIEVIPDNPDLRFLFPIPGGVRALARVLRDHGVLRLAFAPDRFASDVRQFPPATEGDSFMRLETCAVDAHRNLLVTGHAWLPDRQRAADCVVIGSVDATGSFQPISLAQTTRSETNRTNNPSKSAAFRRTFNLTNLPAGEVTIAAWAVDLTETRLLPLGGATRISVPPR